MQQDFESKLSAQMDHLVRALDPLVAAIPADRPIIYFDQPIHLNVGDLLINAGLEALMAANGRQVVHRFSVHGYKRFLNMVTDEHVLVMHGGGNMGDIWPAHEPLRQHIVKRFPRNKIVVCPQTVFFKDKDKVEDYASTYRNHPDCTLFVRDRTSLDFVNTHFGVPCHLAPDTAHYLWKRPGFEPVFSGTGELRLGRNDLEAQAALKDQKCIDWDDLLNPADHITIRPWKAALRYMPTYAAHRQIMAGWYLHRDNIIQRMCRAFAPYETIRTDRLHAIILGCLLGKKVYRFDNSYGKLSTYCDAWFPDIVMRAEP